MGKAKMNKLENRKHTEVLNLRAAYLKKTSKSTEEEGKTKKYYFIVYY